MKKIIKILLIVCIVLSFITINSTSFAVDSGIIEVKVTEKLPGLECDGSKSDYTCKVGTWFSSFTILLKNLVKWFSYIAMLWAILFIIINGILYTMWMDKEWVKKRIIQTLLWIIVLMLSWVILYLVAPWVYY